MSSDEDNSMTSCAEHVGCCVAGSDVMKCRMSCGPTGVAIASRVVAEPVRSDQSDLQMAHCEFSVTLYLLLG